MALGVGRYLKNRFTSLLAKLYIGQDVKLTNLRTTLSGGLRFVLVCSFYLQRIPFHYLCVKDKDSNSNTVGCSV